MLQVSNSLVKMFPIEEKQFKFNLWQIGNSKVPKMLTMSSLTVHDDVMLTVAECVTDYYQVPTEVKLKEQ